MENCDSRMSRSPGRTAHSGTREYDSPPPAYDRIFPQNVEVGVTKIQMDNYNEYLENSRGNPLSQVDINGNYVNNENENLIESLRESRRIKNRQRRRKSSQKSTTPKDPPAFLFNSHHVEGGVYKLENSRLVPSDKMLYRLRTRKQQKRSTKIKYHGSYYDYEFFPIVTEQKAKTLLQNHLSQMCLWPNKKHTVIFNILPSFAFHYHLETFTEERSTSESFEPYKGQKISSVASGTAPMPWEIKCEPPKYFESSCVKIKVPHTSTKVSCNSCSGSGKHSCCECHGGRKTCWSCNGTSVVIDHTEDTHRQGHYHDETCNHCLGAGSFKCLKCNGSDKIVCCKCEGSGKLEKFIKLTVKWTCHKANWVENKFDIPKQEIAKRKGKIIYENEDCSVDTISDYHCCMSSVRHQANSLIHRHKAMSNEGRMILRQRHQIRLIPLTEVMYDKNYKHFYIIGTDEAVYMNPKNISCCSLM